MNKINQEFLRIEWNVEDIIEAIEDEGLEADDELIKTVLCDRNGIKYMEERSIEYGWSVLHNMIVEAVVALKSSSNA